MLYEIDPDIMKLDDERIIALKEGRIRHEDFLKLIDFTKDPFVFSNGRLTYYTEEMRIDNWKTANMHYKDVIMKYGGITGLLIYEHVDRWVEVFPEIVDMCADIRSKIALDGCNECSKNREMFKVVEKIISLASKDRNVESLNDILIGYPFAIRKLKGENIMPDEIPDLDVASFMRRDLRNTGEGADLPAGKLTENPFGIPRTGCDDCGRKHVSNAIRLLKRARYSDNDRNRFILVMSAIAELNEASDELIPHNRNAALHIREIKNTLMGQGWQ